jgi:hypothetical protein
MLDARQRFVWTAEMKMKFCLLVAIAATLTAGCINTVSGNKAGAVPLVRDRVEGRYERPAATVLQAAKEVLAYNGMVTAETKLATTNNIPALALEGKVNQRSVWVRVEQVDPRISAVTVQARTKWGGRDLDLAHQLEKEIAVKLAQ